MTRRPGPCWPATPGPAPSRIGTRSPAWARGRTRLTADRTEFLGRNGTPAARGRLPPRRPVRPGRHGLRSVRGDHDADLTLAAGQSEEVVFVLGQATDRDEVRRLVRKIHRPRPGAEALRGASEMWDRVLGAVQVRTPDPAIDLLVNRWLPYQVLACRVWARSAFYQSGGAYGFRDQLQDVMALVYGAPAETRAQILRAAARQFEEGDVQHWWHPPAGRGVRTRITDDLFFLPLVVHHYVTVTGDVGLLDEHGAVPEGAGPAARIRKRTTRAGRQHQAAPSTSTASASWSTATGSGRTACR